MNQTDSASRTKKRRRRAAALSDRGTMRVEAVTKATHEPPVEPEEKSTGGLANMTGSGTPGEGGALYPAQGPEFKGLLDDEKARQPQGAPTHTNKKMKQKATVNHDTIAKLVDVNSYDASVQSNTALRDDFNVVMSWFGEWKKRPSGHKYGRRKLGSLMHKILTEATKRGDVILMRFNTEKMEPEQREFFLEVAARAGVPKEMMNKSMDEIDLVNLDVSKFKLDKLYKLHSLSHLMHAAAKKIGKSMDAAKLVGLHALVVSEMSERGSEHPLPPRDELDRTSQDFEVVNLNKFREDSNPGGFASVDKRAMHEVLKEAASELWDVCKGCACKSKEGACEGTEKCASSQVIPIDSRKFVGSESGTPTDKEPPVPDPGSKPKHPIERPPGGNTIPQTANTRQ